MPWSANSLDAQRVQASSAALLATYAEKRGALVSTPMELILTTCPLRLATMPGKKPMVTRRQPK
ncbi:hypothetical protein D3C86_2199760 [compost metagenome]